jgi:hypothetical protein
MGHVVDEFREPTQLESSLRVAYVAATEKRPFHTLITMGLSDQPIAIPASASTASRHVELMMTLPEDWQMNATSRTQVDYQWPITELFRLAQLHDDTAWLGWGQAIPNGTPPRAYAPNTELCGVILAPSLMVKQEFYELILEDRTVLFLSAIPLYREELELWRRQGMAMVFGKLLDHGVKDVVHPRRRNIARKRFGLF